MGRQARGRNLWGVGTPEVFLWSPRQSYAVCGWKCGWKFETISEKGPEPFQEVLSDLNSTDTLSVLNKVLEDPGSPIA